MSQPHLTKYSSSFLFYRWVFFFYFLQCFHFTSTTWYTYWEKYIKDLNQYDNMIETKSLSNIQLNPFSFFSFKPSSWSLSLTSKNTKLHGAGSKLPKWRVASPQHRWFLRGPVDCLHIIFMRIVTSHPFCKKKKVSQTYGQHDKESLVDFLLTRRV